MTPASRLERRLEHGLIKVKAPGALPFQCHRKSLPDAELTYSVRVGPTPSVKLRLQQFVRVKVLVSKQCVRRWHRANNH